MGGCYEIPMSDGLRILLIEDDEALRSALAHSLSNQYEILAISTLTGGRSALRAQDWDVVLLDLGLPDGNGLTLLPDIRRLIVHPAVIVLTGNDDLSFARMAINEGADDYVVKTQHLLEELRIRIPLCVERLRRYRPHSGPQAATVS